MGMMVLRRPELTGTSARVVSMEMFEKLTRSTVPPSLMNSPRPMPEFLMTQLDTLMSRKSPLDAVPSLNAAETDSSTQLFTTRFSIALPFSVLGHRQSSPAIIEQLEIKTLVQDSGSMPSVLTRK